MTVLNRGDLTNEQWTRLTPLRPPQRARIVNGMLRILRTGAPWRDLPARYGPWQTVASRFYRWRQAGGWERLLATVQQQADSAGHLDGEGPYGDGTVVRVHQHAAGGGRGTPATEALGYSQGGFSTKIHRWADERGQLLTLLLPPGQQHERTVLIPLLEQGRVKRQGRERPRLRPRRVVGDKGYSSRSSGATVGAAVFGIRSPGDARSAGPAPLIGRSIGHAIRSSD